jgi:hypothetical protein
VASELFAEVMPRRLRRHFGGVTMVAPTTTRVSDNTQPSVNEMIQRDTQVRISHYSAHPEEIEQRLFELDEEWDIERALETGSSALSLAGIALAVVGSRKWLVLPLVVQGFFMQHAIQGWCPPLPVLRLLGFRTTYEIEEERRALMEILGSQEQASRSEASPQVDAGNVEGSQEAGMTAEENREIPAAGGTDQRPA